MRILIADDHPMLRLALKHVLAAEFPRAEFGEAGTAAATLELARAGSWSVVILDIAMPGRSGLDVLKELGRTQPQLPILVLSGLAEGHFAVRILSAGAMGYLTKESSPAELVKAIRLALAGQRYITPSVADKLAAAAAAGLEPPPPALLSNREFVVLQLMAQGKSPKEIAFELSLSIKTVSTYRARLLEKLQLDSNAALIRYALENGVTP